MGMNPIPGRDTIIQFFLKCGILFCSLLLKFDCIYSQTNNLVNNPSFEQRTDFQYLTEKNWSKCLKNDTPDYIEFTNRGEPEFYYSKYIGGLLPIEGDAYVGIFCYRTNPLRGFENVREFIQAPLKEGLVKDTIYLIRLYIALDPESTTAIDNFNVCFVREPISLKKEKQMFGLYPQIKFRQSYFDAISWIRLEAIYKAKGYESHIVLGNFLPDNLVGKKRVSYESMMMKKWYLQGLERASYYYIDMVSVVKQSDQTAEVKKESEKIKKQEKIQSLSPEIDDTIKIEKDNIHYDSSIILSISLTM